jgi:hypothetical protein
LTAGRNDDDLIHVSLFKQLNFMENRPFNPFGVMAIFNVFTVITFITVFAGCAKNSAAATTESATRGGPVVYVAGDNGNNPVIWKNGVETVLSSSKGSANQVLVSANAVYVAGIDGESSSISPGGSGGENVYWKDGVQHHIAVVGAGPSGSPSIAVSGDTVYYANSQLFKNGIPMPLPGLLSVSLQTVVLSGTDVYVAGADSVGDVVYWKNAVLHVVVQADSPSTNQGFGAGAYCMAVSGNDVYVGGYNNAYSASYWKNGVETRVASAIPGGFTSAVNSLFIVGNDVYASGWLTVPANGNGGGNAPAYWKNGVEVDLPLNGADFGYARSIFVYGSDVYVTGWTSSSAAVYWKNGVETVLSSGGSANSIFVK